MRSGRVGANGSGKTTLFDVLGFLKDCLTFNVKSAVQKRGGTSELLPRGAKGESLEIEIQFQMAIAGVERLATCLLVISEGDQGIAVKRELRNQDSSACESVKQRLTDLSREAERPETLVRVKTCIYAAAKVACLMRGQSGSTRPSASSVASSNSASSLSVKVLILAESADLGIA